MLIHICINIYIHIYACRVHALQWTAIAPFSFSQRLKKDCGGDGGDDDDDNDNDRFDLCRSEIHIYI
jgi:hypothetical protein